MSTAPAPRAFEAFDEGFDVDLEFDAAPAGGHATPFVKQRNACVS